MLAGVHERELDARVAALKRCGLHLPPLTKRGSALSEVREHRYRRPTLSGQEESDAEIVFVCTGNRARSPLAEALLRRRIAGNRVRVVSRGTMDTAAAGVLPEMMRAADGLGVDLTSHVTRPLARGELANVSLVVGFEPWHVASAVVDGKAPAEVAFTLLELLSSLERLGKPDMSRDPVAGLGDLVRRAHAHRPGGDRMRAPSIADPLGASQETFDRLAADIAAMVDSLAFLMFGIGGSDPTASRDA
jgi:protein-tyrosine phosphatase